MHAGPTWIAAGFRLWAHTELASVLQQLVVLAWTNGGRIRCPSHEKTPSLIDLFASFAYSKWVLSWQLTLTVLTQVHDKVCVLVCEGGEKECAPIGGTGGGVHDCMKGSSVLYYRCRKRRCPTGNVTAEEDKGKAWPDELFFSVSRFAGYGLMGTLTRYNLSVWTPPLSLHQIMSYFRNKDRHVDILFEIGTLFYSWSITMFASHTPWVRYCPDMVIHTRKCRPPGRPLICSHHLLTPPILKHTLHDSIPSELSSGESFVRFRRPPLQHF
jgi:hypothetical protein